jgi:hypothetical protein
MFYENNKQVLTPQHVVSVQEKRASDMSAGAVWVSNGSIRVHSPVYRAMQFDAIGVIRRISCFCMGTDMNGLRDFLPSFLNDSVRMV